MQVSNPWSKNEVSSIIAPAYCLGKVYRIKQRKEEPRQNLVVQVEIKLKVHRGQYGHRTQRMEKRTAQRKSFVDLYMVTFFFFTWVNDQHSMCMWSYLRPRGEKTSERVKGENPQSLYRIGNCVLMGTGK